MTLEGKDHNPIEHLAKHATPEWEIGEHVSLLLVYEGPLPTGNAGSSNAIKNRIRRILHSQLERFASGDYRFTHLVRGASHGRPVLKGVEFVPVIQDGYIAELVVDMRRRERPGQIFNGGDLDGRLKTLFDGLRIPHEDNEVHGFEASWTECLCLLEDDRQITGVTIETHQLFRDPRVGENPTDVEVSIKVDVNRAVLL